MLSDSLSEKEQKNILQYLEINKMLLHQWKNAEDLSMEINENQLWNRIQRETYKEKVHIHSNFFKWYGIVASILLIMALSGIVVLMTQRNITMPVYVVSSGIQNHEKVILPDGSKVCLGPASRLEYSGKFITDSRDIKLKGQAFFDVVKDPDKPFIVHTGDIEVEALGTAFELFNYDDMNEMEAILVNGKIKVNYRKELRYPQTFYMCPDERMTLNKSTNQIKVDKLNADKYTMWRTGTLSFENENLSMILPRLEHWYGRKIRCDNKLMNKYRFTFKVRDESIETILFIMAKSAPLAYKRVNERDYKITLNNKERSL